MNNLAAQPAIWQPSVTVNNSGAAEMIAGLMTEVKGLREEVKHMGLYLDGDLLVGGIGDRMGEELAATAFRIR